jgi:hypothetical protein
MASQIIAIEEHFTSPALRDTIAPRPGPIQTMLDDMTGRRIKDMDEAGIDIAVLSENNPAAHNLPPEKSVALAKSSNDFLYEQIKATPTRFKGFAALPLPDPKAAADELERCVTRLGMLGAMVMGTTQGNFIDDKKYWPVFERATKLDVPVYIHPSPVKPAVVEAFFKDHAGPLSGAPLALWAGDADPHVPADHVRRVRPVSDAEDHRRSSRRNRAIHAVADRAQSGKADEDAEVVQRLLQNALLAHHQRRVLEFGAGLRDGRDGRRARHVRGRLALHQQRARHQMAEGSADQRQGSRSDFRGQCPQTAEDVIGVILSVKNPGIAAGVLAFSVHQRSGSP